MQVSLYVRRGPTSGQLFPLSDAGLTLIGRNPSNHVVLLDRHVSANHCVIRPRRSGAGFVLMDARSRHGTRVNDRPSGKALIGLGDLITLGPFDLEVVETPPGEYPLPPSRPAAARPPRFEIAPRGWRKQGQPLPPGSATVLGRSRLAQVRVDDTFASACHCLLCLDPTDDGRMPFVIDLRSSNGTYINRRPIHRKHLLPGDTLVIGDHRYKLRRLGTADLAAPEPEVEIPAAPARSRTVTTHILPAADPAQPAPRQTPEPVAFAPEPGPSLADVLAPVEPDAGHPLHDLLTDDDLEPLEPAAEQAPEPAQPPLPPRDTETRLLPRETAPGVEPVAEQRPGSGAFHDTRELELPAPPEPAARPEPPARLLAHGPDDYDDFFGFARPPFALVPDPDCFYDSQHHWDALDTLVRWLKAGPPVAVLFGDMGCGKSLLVECVARRLSYRRPAPVVVRGPLDDLSPAGVAALTLTRAAEVHAELAAEGADPLARWRAAMRELYARRGLVALLLDDADALPDDDLRTLATLLDSEEARAVVRVLLAGGESLRELVAEPPLSYHLGTSCYLAPLAPGEVAGYLAHRIFHASGQRQLPFTRRATELLAEASGGVPTLINVVADAALLEAHRGRSRRVGYDLVARAIDLALEPGGHPDAL